MDTRAVKGKGTPVDETVVDESEYSNEDASSIDVQEPASALKAACSGFLLKRLDVWLTRFPDIVDEFGLATWQELRPYAHMQPGVIGEAFRALVAHKAGKDQQFFVSIPHTLQLGQLLSELAKDNAERLSPPRGSPARSGGSQKTESELSRDTAKLAIYTSIKNDIKLETVYGEGQPPTPSPTTLPPPKEQQGRQEQKNWQQQQQQEDILQGTLQGALMQETQHLQQLVYRPMPHKIVFDRGKLCNNGVLTLLG